MAGTVTVLAPLLGTPAASVVGYVKPPSVDKKDIYGGGTHWRLIGVSHIPRDGFLRVATH